MTSKSNLITIGICIGLSLGFCIALLFFYMYKWFKSSSSNESTTSSIPMRSSFDASDSTTNPTNTQKTLKFPWFFADNRTPNTYPSGVKHYSLKEIQKATQNFTSVLGEGAFGPVYKAESPSGDTVAVKALASTSKQGDKEFHTEVALLGRLHHRNLVNLVGYCIEKGQRMLIYEYMSNGSLANFLHEENDVVLSWDQRLQIAVDIAHGIEYLHEGAVPPVLHRDLKSANILLDQSLRAKVADFGLSKEANNIDRRNSTLKGTYGYIDPLYISSNKYTKKSDVYSFGVILFELITAIHPHRNLKEYIDLASMSADGVDEIIDEKLVGECDVSEVRELGDVAFKCLSMKRRPSISEVLQRIVKIREKKMSHGFDDCVVHVNRIEHQLSELSRITSQVEVAA